MNITIEKNPTFNNISIAYKQLINLKVNTNKLLNKNFVDQLNPKQFVYVIGITSYEGRDFNSNFEFIKSYVSKVNPKDINLLLELEGQLYQYFLKRYETEECYQKFFSFFDNIHKKNKIYLNQNSSEAKLEKLLFFVHSPVFLAHTNPLFFMLKNRKNFEINITVTSLHKDENFTKILSDLKVNFILLKGHNLSEQLNSLILLSSDFSKIIWQSVPIYLGFVSSRIDNICLWSFKFHPKINNVTKNLASFLSYKKSIFFQGNKWENIDVGFEIKNLGFEQRIWIDRKLKFGAFCREELINDESYWLIVKSILENVKNSIFYYCGKKKIDAHWSKKLNISGDRIVFLGWLKEPHLKLKEMSFLLDGYKLGHGYLAYEAMAAAIPIIFPYDRRSYGTMETYTKKLSTHPEHKKYLNNYKKYFLSFKSRKEASNLANKLLTDERFNNFYGKFNRELITLYPKDTFEDFCKIVLD